ncbi:ankyrin repeat-containing protein [Anaeramoeba ignava]|uniref:Ankyrin repeat-containing protein n=1 Tax=Anaeramoeba ignava TaxID=1746090 RepID=A0A9Q0R715_ANAIG|nr:ankyrin repeat-containing protein [Anaeramoeba ignava]
MEDSSDYFIQFQKILQEQNPEEKIEEFLSTQNLTSNQLNSLLGLAIKEKSNTEILQKIISKGVNINTRNKKSRRTVLANAIAMESSLEIIKFLISSGSDVNIVDRLQLSPIHLAIKYMKEPIEVIKTLLEFGANINSQNKSGQTPLHFAISTKSSLEIIQFLISSGASISVITSSKDTMLHYCATYFCSLDILKSIYSESIDINARNKRGRTVLSELIQKLPDSSEHIRFLVSKGAKDFLALQELIQSPNSLENIKLLSSLGVSLLDKNEKNETLLHLACTQKDSLELVDFLIDYGLEVNSVTTANYTPLCYANIYDDNSMLIKKLLSKGADPNIFPPQDPIPLLNGHYIKNDFESMFLIIEKLDPKFYPSNQTVFRFFIENCISGYAERLNKILAYCLNNTTLKNSYAFLVFASLEQPEIFSFLWSFKEKFEFKVNDLTETVFSRICSTEVMKILLDEGFDTNSILLTMDYPIHRACCSGHPKEILQKIIQNGADINKLNNSKQTPLMYSCFGKLNYESIEFLVNSGADLNAVDSFGNSAFLHLCNNSLIQEDQNEIIKVIELFISKGVDIHQKNNQHQNGLFLACSQHHFNEKLAKFLLEHDLDITNPTAENYRSVIQQYSRKSKLDIETLKIFLRKITDEEICVLFEFLVMVNGGENFEVTKYLLENGYPKDINQVIYPRNKSTILHSVVSSVYHIEKFKVYLDLLISRGADFNLKNTSNQTPLHLICKRHQSFNDWVIPIMELTQDFDSIDAYGLTPLGYLCLNKSKNPIIARFLKSGADPNKKSGDTLILGILNKFGLFGTILWLLWYGADYHDVSDKILSRNSTNIQKLLQTFPSYQNDFLKLLKKQQFTDFRLQCKDGSINIHKLILETRLFFEDEKLTNKEIFDSFLKVSHENSIEIMNPFIEFLYTGKIYQKNYTKTMEDLTKITKEIGIDSKKWIIQKRGKIGLVRDFKRIYNLDDQKDFSINSENQEIKVHKLILIARSRLFRGMFLTVNDPSNSVKDYSGKSAQTIQQFIHFLYFDCFDSEKIFDISLFSELKDFYQLRKNSSIDFLLENKKKSKFIEIQKEIERIINEF